MIETVCTIRSMRHPRVDGPIVADYGHYELEVEVELEEARASGDPLGFIKHTIAQYLASCVKTSGLPLGDRCWSLEFSQFMQTEFNYPQGIVT